SELHPIYAMAIRINEDPNDETWVIFVRNWGNEGYCSELAHPLDSQTITFRLPMTGAIGMTWTSTFYPPGEASKPYVDLAYDEQHRLEGALVSFNLPSPDEGALITGKLHLRWSFTPGF